MGVGISGPRPAGTPAPATATPTETSTAACAAPAAGAAPAAQASGMTPAQDQMVQAKKPNAFAAKTVTNARAKADAKKAVPAGDDAKIKEAQQKMQDAINAAMMQQRPLSHEIFNNGYGMGFGRQGF